ncbi:HTH-type transcriptional regulator DmlR [Tepidimonas fonticaldi]|uniref:HTH-type transcriptional regulator DmlR n=1 Tax=Tepidimonas fonticaldi TaxID=1101373 RepID=A0A554XL46_9BURK|nr:LysR family transcriptional regulator [Tepidimonas fonticaldi]TSE36536.1 HTH-type transcriptional regulator DmlR [Tepidimonas fonticaldi]
MDRLQSLRVFQAVADAGGFAAAARALDLSAASVTRMVADLEAQLGVRLLQRTTRRVALTDEGAAYLERVRRILADLDEADALVSQRSQTVAGVLRVLATPVLASVLVAPVVPRLTARHAALRVEVDVESYAVPSVEEHDVALFTVEGTVDTGLIARRIASGVSALVAAPAYLQRVGRPTRPEDLMHHHCLRYRPPGQHAHAWTLWRADQPDAVSRVAVEPVACSNHVEALLRMALEGGGILAVSLDLVAHRLASGELVRVLDGWVTDHWSLYAALPSRRHLPARTRAFLDELTHETATLLRT